MGLVVDLVAVLVQFLAAPMVVQELSVRAMQAVIQVLITHLIVAVAAVARVRLVVLAVICLEMGVMG
jgi:hypothetical protein